jgi:leader peptidase (prepilin peptidase) / N-methyltransferase
MAIRIVAGRSMIDASWFWPILVAPFIGSFLGVVVGRPRAPTSILFGRSACLACDHTLGPRDLVPIVSWLMTGGCCRYCGARVSLFYPAIELAALGVAVWAATSTSQWEFWASCVLGWTLLALAITDFREYLLPDFLTLPLIAVGFAEAAVFEPQALLSRVVAASIGLGAVLALRVTYRLARGREGIGLGDAKLLAAAGAWVSWDGLPSVILIASLCALASVLPRAIRAGEIPWIARVPFGAFLCLGIWLVWRYGPLDLALLE